MCLYLHCSLIQVTGTCVVVSHTSTSNQDQELGDFLQYENEEWNNNDREDDFPPADGFKENIIGREVVHGENVANML